jgi:hypothetical protein
VTMKFPLIIVTPSRAAGRQTAEQRALLFTGASFAAIRLQKIVEPSIKRIGKALTPRELAVLRLLSNGKRLAEIAAFLRSESLQSWRTAFAMTASPPRCSPRSQAARDTCPNRRNDDDGNQEHCFGHGHRSFCPASAISLSSIGGSTTPTVIR